MTIPPQDRPKVDWFEIYCSRCEDGDLGATGDYREALARAARHSDFSDHTARVLTTRRPMAMDEMRAAGLVA